MDEARLIAKFDEWTSGLKPKEARIAVFEHIRDIPYAIVPALRDPANGPAGILEMGRGSCQPKHWLLAILFKHLGIEVKYATYPFKWGDQGIKFPPDIEKMAGKLPSAYHLACKAYIDGRWILVDATYDLPLAKYGFAVNISWDGTSDTKNAVKPIIEVLHKTPEERVRYETDKKSLYSEQDKALYAEFIDKLNAWLGEIREG